MKNKTQATVSRRDFISLTAGGSAAALGASLLLSPEQKALAMGHDTPLLKPSTTPVYSTREAPKVGEHVQEFEIELRITTHEIVPGVKIHAYTYNGTYPGPEIRVTEGDWVLVHFKNSTSEIHTIHWHGIQLACEMDGVPNATQWGVGPGQSFKYLFRAQPTGTHFYHCHNMTNLHVQAGMFGSIIIEPKEDPIKKAFPYERDYTLLLSEVDTTLVEKQMEQMQKTMGLMKKMNESPHLMKEMNGRMMGWFTDKKAFLNAVATGYVPPYVASETAQAANPRFNYFLINGKSFPMTDALSIRMGENIRVRLINPGAIPHFMHLHGHDFWQVAIDGAPLSNPIRLNTVPVFPGNTTDIIIEGNNPGMWHFHDHSDLATTNNGIFPGGMMTMLMYEDAEKYNITIPGIIQVSS